MQDIDKKDIKKSLIINYLFVSFPLSFILGNFFINLNIALLVFFTFFFFFTELKKIKVIFLDKIIISFFIYSFFILVINFLESKLNNNIFSSLIIDKTIFYLRYLLLYVSLRCLVNQNILKFNWFFFSCAFFSIFVCVDVYIQYIFGKDIFGYEPIAASKFSGPFGDELIAGGYIQKFSLFSLFLPFVLNQKSKLNKILIQLFLVILFITGIIVSGNRMPLLLFVFSLFLFFIFSGNIRKYIFPFFLVLSLGLVFLNFQKKDFHYNITKFYNSVEDLVNIFYTKKIPLKVNENLENWKKPYVTEFYCFGHIWKKNIFTGGGIRSYRTFPGGCNNHPHNYYFEILVDLGLFGFFIILFLVFNILYKMFLLRNIFNLETITSKQIIPFFLVLCTELFPIRSSGSFFSTSNATFIFMLLAVLVTLIEKHVEAKNTNKKLQN